MFMNDLFSIIGSILSCPSSIDSTKSKRKKSSPKMDLSSLLSGLKDPLT